MQIVRHNFPELCNKARTISNHIENKKFMCGWIDKYKWVVQQK